MTEDNSDYITLLPVWRKTDYFVVCVMKYHPQTDEYIQTKIAPQPLNRVAAEALAKHWGESMKLEIR